MVQCEACNLFVDPKAAVCSACGTPRAEMQDLVFAGQYEVERELGHGGMGVVYLARDRDLCRQVAVKVVAPRYASDSGLVARLKREATALASVRHPHVVQVYSFGVARSPYFVMEFVKGRSLADIIGAHVLGGIPISARRAVTIIRQIASALDAVHEVGLLHRDVKPDNIIIEDGSGRPVLVDFGLVATLDAAPSTDSIGCGTPQYMAPEQATTTGTAARLLRQADVFALGCTAYEVLTGALPFHAPGGKSPHPRARELVPPSRLQPALACFDEVIARALAPDPAERFETASALAAALERALPRLSAPPPTSAVRPRERDVVRVLVVDDDEAMARYAARAAQLAFYRKRVRVATASSGGDALRAAATEMPDLVVLDYSMPGLDGIETLARLRERPGGANARVLVFSANATEQQQCRFALLGVTAFLTKPVSLQALIDTIGGIGRAAGWLDGDGTHALSA